VVCSPSFHAYDIQDTCISIGLQAATAIPSDGFVYNGITLERTVVRPDVASCIEVGTHW
jgi:hypothetical protein